MLPVFLLVSTCVEIEFLAPHCHRRDAVSATTSARWREVHGSQISQDNLTHWLISTPYQLEEHSRKIESHVLEGISRPVEQLQQVVVSV